MQYEMYQEILDQPQSMVNTLKYEKEHMILVADKLKQFDMIYIVGCGSSISTCYSIRDAIKTVSSLNINVQTGYEFAHNQYLKKDSNVGVVLTSQSGETSDTVAAMRKAKEYNIYTVSIVNEKNSTLMEEADDSIFTRCGKEEAILGTKTYVTQLLVLYWLFFSVIGGKRSLKILKELEDLPDLLVSLINTTEDKSLEIAKENKDVDIFYCMGSGVNFGLAYKLAMTMFMEGALKHACPLYSGEFRHGLIERVEENVTVLFLKDSLEDDSVMDGAINICDELKVNSILFDLKEYSNVDPLLAPFILVIPLEWFIYHLADLTGEDPGSTRHIGKIRY